MNLAGVPLISETRHRSSVFCFDFFRMLTQIWTACGHPTTTHKTGAAGKNLTYDLNQAFRELILLMSNGLTLPFYGNLDSDKNVFQVDQGDGIGNGSGGKAIVGRSFGIDSVGLSDVGTGVEGYSAESSGVWGFGNSVARLTSMKVLPVDLPVRPFPVAIVTLKNRTLSPVVERFIECAREVAKSMAGRPGGQTAQRRKPNVS